MSTPTIIEEPEQPEETPFDVQLAALRRTIELAQETGAAISSGTALAPTMGPAAAGMMKQDLASNYSALAHVRKTAVAAREEAKSIIESKKRELEAMLREMNTMLEPLEKQLARMKDGVHAFNLYLGRDEDIVLIRDGEPATAETPVFVRQQTLAMDEESVIHAEDGGLDFSKVDLFIDWLKEDPKHVDQIIPETKAIVALRPRNSKKDYGRDPWAVQANDANLHSTYWLIRNGDRLWISTTDFYAGTHMVPKADEFTSMFVTDRWGRPLKPGTSEWQQAEDRADARTRHYMKVALVLQGLADRTKVFHPLTDAGLSFIDQSFYDNGIVRVITDDELAIGTGRQPFYKWLAERNESLDTGMRIVGAFHSIPIYDDTRNYIRAQVRPQGSRPAKGVYVVKRIDDMDFNLSFTFDRTGDDVWDDELGQYREAKTKGTCKISTSDRFIIPIDRVSIEELEEYIGARSERHAYVDMFPLLRAAWKFKVEEREAEKSFLDALVANLATTAGYDNLDALETEAQELISWYKTSNRWHRPLDADDQKASRLILTEAKRRRTPDTSGKTVTAIRKDWAANGDGREIMAIVRRTNDYLAVVPETRAFKDDVVSHTVFVTIREYTSTGKFRNEKRWVNPTHTQTARWTAIEQTELWSTWTIGADPSRYFSDPEIQEVIDTVQAHYAERRNSPFDIRWNEGNKSLPRFGVQLYTTSTEDAYARSPITVKRVAGKLDVTIASYSYGSRWSSGTPDIDVNYGGQIRPHQSVWTDTAIADALRADWAVWNEKQNAARAFNSRVNDYTWGLAEKWRADAWETARLRYLEDFGDDGLWADHKKTLKEPVFPFRNDYKTTSAMELAVRQLVQADVEIAGLTVKEVIALSEKPEAAETMDPAYLALRFPTKKDA